MWIIILIILFILCVGGLPNFGFHNYGYGPSGLLGFILVVVLVLFLLGRL